MNVFGNLAEIRFIEFHDGDDVKKLAAFLRDGIVPIESLRFRKSVNIVNFCVLIKANAATRTPRQYQVQINHATNVDVHMADTANTSGRFSLGNMKATSPSCIIIETYDGLTIDVSTIRIDGFCRMEENGTGLGKRDVGQKGRGQLLPAFLMSHFWPICDGRDVWFR